MSDIRRERGRAMTRLLLLASLAGTVSLAVLSPSTAQPEGVGHAIHTQMKSRETHRMMRSEKVDKMKMRMQAPMKDGH